MHALNSVESNTQGLEQCALNERNVVRQRNNISCTHGHIFCECTWQVGTVERTIVADVDHALIAVGAGVIEQNRVSGYTHANLEVARSVLAYFSDDTGEFVTENCREMDVIRIEESFLTAMQRVIGAANAASLDLKKYFVVFDLRNRSILNILPWLFATYAVNCIHCTFHVQPLSIGMK